jgi:hypothetical protein
MMTIRRVRVELTSEFELNLVEAELAISLLQDLPTLIRGSSGNQILVKVTEPQLGN